MENPGHPGTALLDFQRESALLVYLAQVSYAALGLGQDHKPIITANIDGGIC